MLSIATGCGVRRGAQCERRTSRFGKTGPCHGDIESAAKPFFTSAPAEYVGYGLHIFVSG